jgi:alginate production protein
LSVSLTGSAGAQQTEPQDELRRRLTEREDKVRTDAPLQLNVAGRPLIISGQAGVDVDYLRVPARAGPSDESDRLLAAELEVEAFYALDAKLAFFAQLRLTHDRARRRGGATQSATYVERGEMWLYAGDLGGTPLLLEVGRLNFEDDRRWWWDAELDAARIAYESQRVEATLAYAQEVAPSRSDRSAVDPEHARVQRWIAHATWDWAPAHALSGYALRHRDRSARAAVGQVVSTRRKDESDARLTWLGAGAAGEIERGTRGVFSYHVDAARVRGDEWLAELDTGSESSVVERVAYRSVRGWAFDAGLRYSVETTALPRVFVAYAWGSGSASTAATDRSFRQTGLQTNEAGFGGVKHFAHYGAALDPELSNLRIATLGIGAAPSRSSSVDVVYHHYRLAAAATSLRGARIDAELTGSSRALGSGIDVVAAVEAAERFELSVIASTFRAGAAFGPQQGQRYWFGGLALRVAF